MTFDLKNLIPFDVIMSEPDDVFDLVDDLGLVVLLKNNIPAYIIMKPERATDNIMSTISFQPKKQVTLHEAMRLVLLDAKDNQMHAAELADEIYKRGLYSKKVDGGKAKYNQIRARCEAYKDMFEPLQGNIIKLKTNN